MDSDDVLGQGRFIRLVRRGRWEFAQRIGCDGAVAIVAVNDAGHLVLVEQHRPAVSAATIELPAGLIGDDTYEGEAAEVTARRELIEETGYDAEHLEVVARGVSSAGFADERIVLVRARGLRKVGPGGGVDGENITVHEIPMAGVEAWLRAQADRGKAIDLKVYSALHFAR